MTEPGTRFYSAEDRSLWNRHNAAARNGHFIFDRDFMEYHADRFQDSSVLIQSGNDLIATLPVNRLGEEAYSHQGLTFGGLLLSDRATASRVLEGMAGALNLLRSSGLKRLFYKAIPFIYHVRPAQEDLYALIRLGAKLVRRDLTTTIDLANPGARAPRRERGLRRARARGLEVGESQRWPEYWEILTSVLSDRHGVRPTHTQTEILLLVNRFPDSIRLITAEVAGEVVAGIVIFETGTVAHAQYIAASPKGRELGALDLVFGYALENYLGRKRFFDFGVSTVNEGRELNEGLVKQKEEFGGSAVVHDTYCLELGLAAA